MDGRYAAPDEGHLFQDIVEGKKTPALDNKHPMHGFVRDCCRHDPTLRPSAAEIAKHLAAAAARHDFPGELACRQIARLHVTRLPQV